MNAIIAFSSIKNTSLQTISYGNSVAQLTLSLAPGGSGGSGEQMAFQILTSFKRSFAPISLG